MEGIISYVKILVFVKILSQWRRKEGQEFRSLEVRETSSSHLKMDKVLELTFKSNVIYLSHILAKICGKMK